MGKKGSEFSNNQRTKRGLFFFFEKHLKRLIFMLDPSSEVPPPFFKHPPVCEVCLPPSLSSLVTFLFFLKVTKKSSVRFCLLEMVGKIHPCYLNHLAA